MCLLLSFCPEWDKLRRVGGRTLDVSKNRSSHHFYYLCHRRRLCSFFWLSISFLPRKHKLPFLIILRTLNKKNAPKTVTSLTLGRKKNKLLTEQRTWKSNNYRQLLYFWGHKALWHRFTFHVLLCFCLSGWTLAIAIRSPIGLTQNIREFKPEKVISKIGHFFYFKTPPFLVGGSSKRKKLS